MAPHATETYIMHAGRRWAPLGVKLASARHSRRLDHYPFRMKEMSEGTTPTLRLLYIPSSYKRHLPLPSTFRIYYFFFLEVKIINKKTSYSHTKIKLPREPAPFRRMNGKFRARHRLPRASLPFDLTFNNSLLPPILLPYYVCVLVSSLRRRTPIILYN